MGKRADGYHELFTVIQSIPMFDVIRISIGAGKRLDEPDMPDIAISCDEGAPSDNRNTAHKAARLYFVRAAKVMKAEMARQNIAESVADSISSTNIVNIEIKKRIPSQAGLGGGSSDAAAVLLTLNEAFGGFLTENELLITAAEVGADVPFFVKTKQEEGAAAFCEGIGEIVTPFIPKANLRDLKIEVIKPECNISTKEAFGLYGIHGKPSPDFDTKSTAGVKNIFKNGSIKDIIGVMRNDFEEIIDSLCGGEIERAKAELFRRGAATAQMTGSGSAVFGIWGTNIHDVRGKV